MSKKIILGILMMVMLTGCGNTKKKDANTITLTDADFVKWTNEITMNPDEYIGDTLTLDGLYMKPGHNEIRNKHGYVYRHGLGCCGTDGGFFGYEFKNDEVEIKDGQWIAVTGEIDKYTEDGNTRLVLKNATVEIKEDHGTIFVAQ